MKKLLAAVLSVAVAVTLSPALSSAQSSSCPAEVTQAKDLLSKAHARLLGAIMINAPHDRGLVKY